MCVCEVVSFNEYWQDARFGHKRPDMQASLSKAFGDNIYYLYETGEWLQADSHHSLADGTPNLANIRRDTSSDQVLISDDFVYWGGDGPEIPLFDGQDICVKGQGHKRNFPGDIVDSFIQWVRDLNVDGRIGDPHDWNSL